MKLHCLGTGGYHPSDDRETACYYFPDKGIVLDAGTGMYRLAECLRNDPRKSLDIFLSHAHLDHIFGLTFTLQFKSLGVEEINVYAEAAKIEAIKEHLFAQLLFPIMPPITFCELSGPVQVGDVQISWFELQHPGGSIGFRLESDGGAIGYVTDTTAKADAPYCDHIGDLDLLIHECYLLDQESHNAELMGHSCAGDVGRVATQTRAKRLLLVHCHPWVNNDDELLSQVRPHFEHVEIATDGLLVRI